MGIFLAFSFMLTFFFFTPTLLFDPSPPHPVKILALKCSILLLLKIMAKIFKETVMKIAKNMNQRSIENLAF